MNKPYDTAAILRQNVADLERELQRQRERADKAEAELKEAREQAMDQKPWAWDCGGNITTNKEYADWFIRSGHGEARPLVLYARPIPAPAPAVSDEWLYKLNMLRSSISGICYMGEKWEISTIEYLLQSAGGGK